MTTAYTSLLGLALPVQGELSGTWGDTVNNSITSLLDSAVAGTTNLSTDADVTLTTTTGAANTSREAILLFSGARTALRTVIAPAQSKIYTVINATTGGFSVKLVGVGPTTGVTIIAGESAVCAWNGSDFVKVSNTGGSASFTNVTVTGTTTLSGLTASTALALDASKNVVSVTNTGSGNNVLSTSPTLVTPLLGTPTSGVATNLTGLPLTTGVTGTLPTANGGTNLTSFTSGGVVYASSSSVLATGSALTFDGTQLGLNVAAPYGGAYATIHAFSAGGATFRLDRTGSGTSTIQSVQTGVAYRDLTLDAANNIFSISGTEQMRLTSSSLYTASGINVGIGTSLPAYKLDVARSGTGFTARIGNGTTATYFYNDGASTYIGGDSAINNCMYIYPAQNQIGWATTNGTTKMLLDGSGNLGLGVTPSAWYAASGFKALQVGLYGFTSIADGGSAYTSRLMNNSYYNSSGIGTFAGSNYASEYRQAAGVHSWHSSTVSGTAGNTISFTQAMTLDASGNLLVGGTSQSGTANRTAVFSANKFGLSIIDTTAQATGVGGALNLGGNYRSAGDAQAFARIAAVKENSTDANYAYGMAFSTTPNGGSFVEAGRFDSSGNLLVGGNSVVLSSKFLSRFDGNTNNGAVLSETANTASTTFLAFCLSGSAIGSVGRVGATSAVIYNTTSDYRLKTVTGAVTGQGARIDALKPVDYLWKEGNTSARGFLAHEFQTVYPNSVTGDKDAVDADGNPKHQSMQAATSEVIADLVAEIQSLRQRLSAANL